MKKNLFNTGKELKNSELKKINGGSFWTAISKWLGYDTGKVMKMHNDYNHVAPWLGSGMK